MGGGSYEVGVWVGNVQGCSGCRWSSIGWDIKVGVGVECGWVVGWDVGYGYYNL